ncbi:hypothetical protein PHYBLDRAFT_66934 [Phycomyces blakesleeanus NRRL 1555(-)]|uniref:Uncharacterized protein n=1 Tax=Phycomyces blakesleeanus (strain ATCC 8743b / DSM 1359 / FGSC 10004 / NBRC 33097 / NRRL 1555) TaxID=763407 RepID=A0A167KTE5_PHYB8|nr:hypothetical protein PHYBLDRAFT_66934 [Phycomyces blakesleeanus NRRL 1555(-)]OAD68828.1 hypothetical protein PHYBLDRAFT_66934 [Phycomyces blakesleeanus NRRL 1555(-)]|eukprot:XP_018286868.1 hypothetical protein PHYBLDRAFT_66934 [Phycomyces blakesleeanus NRRL 1555(-)]
MSISNNNQKNTNAQFAQFITKNLLCYNNNNNTLQTEEEPVVNDIDMYIDMDIDVNNVKDQIESDSRFGSESDNEVESTESIDSDSSDDSDNFEDEFEGIED